MKRNEMKKKTSFKLNKITKMKMKKIATDRKCMREK